MPPPSAVDPWLHGRRFGIVIDAGSSGSRLQIYSWRDAVTVRLEQGEQAYHSLPKVEKGVREGEEWVTKVEPGISSFASNLEDVGPYLAPLLEHARSQIPPSLQPSTPLFLLATAGMRLLPPSEQASILTQTCSFLKFHSNFRIDDPSPSGPCGSSVRIITGEEEGLFGWIAVNYLMDGFGKDTGEKDVDVKRTTYGFLDMGGASTQIAFEPKQEYREGADNLIEVRLRLLGGEEIKHQVFVTTWLGYGTNQARERYIAKIVDEFERAKEEVATTTPDSVGSYTDPVQVPDPCLPKNLELPPVVIQHSPTPDRLAKSYTLFGTGSFPACLTSQASLLNKHLPCTKPPCPFNGIHVPPIDFSSSHFIGVSEYWYSSEHVFGLGGAWDYVEYERAAESYCGRGWTDLMEGHWREPGRVRVDAGVEETDSERATGVQAEPGSRLIDRVEISRLQMQCFKAAWIVNVLHEGLGMPRITDPGGNATGHQGEQVAEKAAEKGLGKPPVFQSVDTVGDVAISWTLGKMVLEASKEVPPLGAGVPPLVDPIDGLSDSELEKPSMHIQPIRPPFLDFDAIEDRISHHLPSALTRQSLGFSFIGLVFYFIFVLSIATVCWRLRRYFGPWVRRVVRGGFKKEEEIDAGREEYLMGGGTTSSGSVTPTGSATPSPRQSRPPSPTSPGTIRRLFSNKPSRKSRRRLPPPIITNLLNDRPGLLRSVQTSPGRISNPTRSFSTPTLLNGKSGHSAYPYPSPLNNQTGNTSVNHLMSNLVPRPSSPSLSHLDEITTTSATFINMNGGNSIYSLTSRSRNSSQMNLSTLPRQQPISRSNSAMHVS
ncbi:hypothetical protein JAAARDRAFT_191339 [Jaapia argillacea MUCL 33604]|uniref:Golgi apyrase n=1 Tax=Jaapia argillacea MUCL 33604 TaxID=933084 RepID=A0A067Q2N0_9AGAM|nr:hypothetical protein JAAARDRAFT_191339 [Jaapia argillacea MUCL 33604]